MEHQYPFGEGKSTPSKKKKKKDIKEAKSVKKEWISGLKESDLSKKDIRINIAIAKDFSKGEKKSARKKYKTTKLKQKQNLQKNRQAKKNKIKGSKGIGEEFFLFST